MIEVITGPPLLYARAMYTTAAVQASKEGVADIPAKHPAAIDEDGDLPQRLGHLLLPLLGVQELQQRYKRCRVG
jgi:hypothetical protein